MRNVKREAAWAKAMQNVGEFLDNLEDWEVPGQPEGTVLTGVSIRLPTADRPEVLIVLKASGEGGRFVGFVGGLDLTQAILVWRARWMAAGMKWRKDRPYGEQERSE